MAPKVIFIYENVELKCFTVDTGEKYDFDVIYKQIENGSILVFHDILTFIDKYQTYTHTRARGRLNACEIQKRERHCDD